MTSDKQQHKQNLFRCTFFFWIGFLIWPPLDFFTYKNQVNKHLSKGIFPATLLSTRTPQLVGHSPSFIYIVLLQCTTSIIPKEFWSALLSSSPFLNHHVLERLPSGWSRDLFCFPDTMLPFTTSQRSGTKGEYNFPDFIRRMCDFRQMDFESAFDQVFNLLSFEPQRVYTSFYHRKREYIWSIFLFMISVLAQSNVIFNVGTQDVTSTCWILILVLICLFSLTLETKNQWARDDPAFVVIQLFFLVVTLCDCKILTIQFPDTSHCIFLSFAYAFYVFMFVIRLIPPLCFLSSARPVLLLWPSKTQVFGDICGQSCMLWWLIGSWLLLLWHPRVHMLRINICDSVTHTVLSRRWSGCMLLMFTSTVTYAASCWHMSCRYESPTNIRHNDMIWYAACSVYSSIELYCVCFLVCDVFNHGLTYCVCVCVVAVLSPSDIIEPQSFVVDSGQHLVWRVHNMVFVHHSLGL